MHLTTLATHSRWLKSCHKIELRSSNSGAKHSTTEERRCRTVNSLMRWSTSSFDKVEMVPTARGRKRDTSAPMEIGATAKDFGENASQKGDQRITDLAMQDANKGTDKGRWEGFSKGQNWNEKGGKGGKDGEKKTLGRRHW